MKEDEEREQLISAFEARQQMFSTEYIKFLVNLNCIVTNISEVYEFQMAPVLKPYILHMSDVRNRAHIAGDMITSKFAKLIVNSG